MWWYKEHNEVVEKWAYYPWYKAIRYANYQAWRPELQQAIEDVSDGFISFWKGVFSLLKLAVLWVLTPVLKPITFIRILPGLRKTLTEKREKRIKEWEEMQARRPEQ